MPLNEQVDEDAQARLGLDVIFSLDTAEIMAARERTKIIHRSRNIVSAGHEVEAAARAVLSRRFPGSSYVGQGHIIDQAWKASKQLDIVIADNFACPIMFKISNGTEYFPYEAVYAIGEVKSTYKSEDDVIEFCKKIEHLKLNLKREKTPQGFISTGRGRGVQLQGLSSDRRPYKNPLFTFMVFANSGKFRKQHLQDLYRSKSVQELPCILCFLDSGVLGYGIVNERGQFSGLHEMPEFASLYQKTGQTSRWMWLENQEPILKATHPLAFLYFQLSSHIRNCSLMPPELTEYGMPLMSMGNGRWEAL
ncbi:MAG: DUF6602 domain-containing protein [Candidatus Obscuribacterales bacterium]